MGSHYIQEIFVAWQFLYLLWTWWWSYEWYAIYMKTFHNWVWQIVVSDGHINKVFIQLHQTEAAERNPTHGGNDDSTVCCLLGQCRDVRTPKMFRTLTFNLNLIPLFWSFVTCSEELLWDHMVGKSASLHPPTHITGQATLRPAKLSFIKEDSMLSCYTGVL
jgi:hypothetical protein